MLGLVWMFCLLESFSDAGNRQRFPLHWETIGPLVITLFFSEQLCTLYLHQHCMRAPCSIFLMYRQNLTSCNYSEARYVPITIKYLRKSNLPFEAFDSTWHISIILCKNMRFRVTSFWTVFINQNNTTHLVFIYLYICCCFCGYCFSRHDWFVTLIET